MLVRLILRFRNSPYCRPEQPDEWGRLLSLRPRASRALQIRRTNLRTCVCRRCSCTAKSLSSTWPSKPRSRNWILSRCWSAADLCQLRSRSPSWSTHQPSTRCYWHPKTGLRKGVPRRSCCFVVARLTSCQASFQSVARAVAASFTGHGAESPTGSRSGRESTPSPYDPRYSSHSALRDRARAGSTEAK